MNIIRDKNIITINKAVDFSPKLMFECGQAFRWRELENGDYIGIVGRTPLKLSCKDEGVLLICKDENDFDIVWKNYFDLDTEYADICDKLFEIPRMRPAIEYGRGIRILKQEFWEALCSFIISQCNNIPRIKGIIDTLCRLYGEEIEFENEILYTFPSAEIIAGLDEEKLSPLRAGYRTKYLINAARSLVNGEIKEENLREISTDSARKELMKLMGVGKKVADCTLLYGLGKMEVYPIDVWMRRVSEEYFAEPDFDGSVFGEHAGIAQQYLFHYIRSLN